MATSSGQVELDAVFIKALKLLHSRHPDSLDQLRALRDEVVRQHSQQVPPPKISKEKPKETKSSMHSERRSSAIISAAEVKAKLSEKKLEGETKQTVPIKPTNPERNLTVEETSVETLESGSSLVETVELSSSSFMDHSSAKKARLHFDVEAVLDEGDLESQSTLQPVVEELMIDLGSACGICYREESKIPGNQLVECHECHSLYHQRCHEPRVMDSEVNDIRHVWYCRQCVKRMREMASSTTPKSRPVESTTSSKPVSSSSRPTPMASFKRPSISDVKPISSTAMHQSFAIPALSTNTASSSSAAAAAAVALSGKPSTSSGSSSSQNVAMQSALKRLQMVKKKAQQRVLNNQQIRIPRR